MNTPGIHGLPPLRPGEVEFRSRHRTLIIPIAPGRVVYFTDGGDYGYHRTMDLFEIEKLRVAVALEQRGQKGLIEMPSTPPPATAPVFTGIVNVLLDRIDEIVVYVPEEMTWLEIAALVADQIVQKLAQQRIESLPRQQGTSAVWVEGQGWQGSLEPAPVTLDDAESDRIIAGAVSTGAPQGRPIARAPMLVHQSMSPEDIAHEVASGSNSRR